MAITTYATIDIGSNQLAMKIYEISRQHGIREITHVRHKLSLGAETYRRGFISYQTVNEICTTLQDFKRIMTEFKTDGWQAYASNELQEARNSLVVMDQIKIQTGFTIKILSNSETCFLYYKALALRESNFDSVIEQGTLVVNIDAGSVQLSIFNQGVLYTTQNLRLGSARIQELLQVMESETYDFTALISEYIERDLELFKELYLNSIDIRHIIVCGEMIPDIYSYLSTHKPHFDGHLAKKTFTRKKFPRDFHGDTAKLIIPTLLLCRKISLLTDCDDLFLSNIDVCDGMVAEYAEKKIRLTLKHDFIGDILSTSKQIAAKYKVEMNHVENVKTLSLQIFDRIRKLHGLGKRERLLLQIGVILHSCGAYINEIKSRECSYHIIMATEIIGLSHRERTMVANMVRYDANSFPAHKELEDDLTREEYITTVKLNAILKTANILDKSNRQKIKKVGVTLKDGVLCITADTMADITLEKGLFHGKADVFEEVFGIRPTLKQRKTGN